MGVSYRATLVVGVRLSDVYREREVVTSVTKYHPDTGQPHAQSVTTTVATLFGREVPPLDGHWEGWAGMPKGLRMFTTGESARPYPGRRPDPTRHVLGLEAPGEEDSDREVRQVDFRAMSDLMQRMRDETLTPLGYQGETTLFLVRSVSC